jgi:dihydroorotase
MSKRTLYRNARLLDPESGLDAAGGLLAERGKIVGLGPQLAQGEAPADCEVVDCAGLCLAPGLVDIRTQLGEPGLEQRETFETASAAAGAGGVTSMVCLPNTAPVIDNEAVAEFIARRAREVKAAKIYCYGTITTGAEGRELSEIATMSAAGCVAFTDGTRALADAQVMRRAMAYARTFDLLLVQHPEEPSLAGGAMHAGEFATRLGLPGIPAIAEVMMIRRDLLLAETSGARLHFAHVATAAGIEAIREARARGLPVTCDTAPHYFTLNELAVADYRTFAKVSPPLRSEADREAVVAGLADGTIDGIASDHAPQDQEGKRVPFDQAEPGTVGLETLLPLTLGLVHNGELDLLSALALVTCRPAALLGLPGGRLAEGAPADLVLFDPDAPWQVDRHALSCKSKNSVFDGMLVQGRVQRTVVDGRAVFGG